MFHKEGSFNTTQGKKAKDVPLKKSERRKLRDAFLSMIPPQPMNEDEDASASAPAPASTSDYSLKEQMDFIFTDSKADISIRKLRLKDAKSNAGATNFYIRTPSPSGHGSLHLWPYTACNQVLLMEVGNIMLPSLALLSTLPAKILMTLPSAIVPCQVSKYLCRGADLMRSGIISISPTSRWVIVRVQNNVQPFAVGFVTKGTDASNIGTDTKGVGVEIIHCYGDEIYKSQLHSNATKSISNGAISEIGGQSYDRGNFGNVGFVDGKFVYGLMREGENDDDDEDNETASDGDGEEEETSTTVDGEGTEEESNEPQDASSTNEVSKSLEKINIVDDSPNDETSCSKNSEEDEHPDDDQEDVEDPEEALLFAFHNALVNISKSDLPMQTAVFYSQHVLPARKEGSFIDLKATRFKKIGVFLMEQAHHGLISIGASKDGKDPIAFIKSIDRSHIELRDARKRKKKAAGGDDSSKKNKSTKKVAVANLFVIPNNIVNLMLLNEDDVKATNAKSETRRGTGYLTAPECRDILNKYLSANQLVDEYDPEMVSLDGPLCDAVFRKTKREIASQGIGNTFEESVTRKELNIKWLERMDKAYAIVAMPGSKIVSMKRGSPPMVNIDVEARQNRRKFITRVRGLEEYSINPSDFATDVSKRFACSSSIDENPTNREALKKGRVEIEFQGNLVEELQALLTGNEKLSSHGGAKKSDYSLPKGVIDVKLRKGVSKRKK